MRVFPTPDMPISATARWGACSSPVPYNPHPRPAGPSRPPPLFSLRWQAIRALDCYGPVTATQCRGSALPYIDELVNLVVVDSSEAVPSEAEIRRVLQDRYEKGELRKETFQLVKSMLDRYVTEQAPTSPGMPDARGRIEPSLGANPAPAQVTMSTSASDSRIWLM